ncbi:MAG: D-glycero-alpha-D-manno-heptose-1,7-bisphosphate 7-phosphatase [Bdellovibrionales bacterium]
MGGDRDAAARGWIILDRDGVINALCVDPEQGTVDSPLHPSQVRLLPGAAEAIGRLCASGFEVHIATNQPAAAKGKTTHANLEATHQRVLELVEAAGGKITSSQICRHQSEDQCSCRKPATGLLEAALNAVPIEARRRAWMVGDGVTDVEAGQRLELKTAYLGPKRCDHCKCLEDRGLKPTGFFPSLSAFADWICTQPEIS